MLSYVFNREIVGKSCSEEKLCQKIAADKIPSAFKERELTAARCYDKVFATAWLDSVNVVLGTKDNKLLVVDSHKDRFCDIPMPGRNGPSHDRTPSCGIHTISINSSRTLLATGGDHPNDVAIFDISSFEPIRLLKKHDDWIFSSSWVTETMLVTGSRDSTVKLWSVVDGKEFINEKPIADKKEHLNKVRDLKYCARCELFATVSPDGTCKVWDPHIMEVVVGISLAYKREVACLVFEYPYIVIGSQKYISFIDTRCGHIVNHVNSLDDGFGMYVIIVCIHGNPPAKAVLWENRSQVSKFARTHSYNWWWQRQNILL